MNAKTTPKDFFLYVAATVCLYVAVVSLINLVFSIVNYSFPDQLAYGYSARSMAWPISMVVVLVPVFYVLEWYINKDIRMMPEKATIWLRRWRTYLTLFLTGATIIGDLIALINVYLSGEITSRFIWKILAVLVIAAIVFVYYMFDRKENTGKKTVSISLAWVGIIIVLAAIIGGFVIVGSPTKQRQLRADIQRVNDLQNVQWQIVSFWQTNGKLPATLTDLKDSISYSNIPKDPETKASYGYNMIASTTFSICADFARKNEDTKGRGPYGGSYATDVSMSYPASDMFIDKDGETNWEHDGGYVCFERKINPLRYPVNKPVI